MVTSLADHEVKDVAHSLLIFGKQTKQEQKIRVIDWIAHDTALDKGLAGLHRNIRQKRCVLPGTYNEMICRHRLAALVGYGQRKWTACSKLMKTSSFPVHGLTGKESNIADHLGIQDAFFDKRYLKGLPKAALLKLYFEM